MVGLGRPTPFRPAHPAMGCGLLPPHPPCRPPGHPGHPLDPGALWGVGEGHPGVCSPMPPSKSCEVRVGVPSHISHKPFSPLSLSLSLSPLSTLALTIVCLSALLQFLAVICTTRYRSYYYFRCSNIPPCIYTVQGGGFAGRGRWRKLDGWGAPIHFAVATYLHLC